MNRHLGITTLLLAALVAPQLMCGALAKNPPMNVPLDGQSSTTVDTPADGKNAGSMGGLSAPGANGLMNPDMLMVTPNNGNAAAKPPEPLKAYIGVSLTLKIERYDISFDKLQGILIEVTNETDRPLVVNGNKATAIVGAETTVATAVSALQEIVIPPHKADQVFEDLLKKVLPAAVTIGAYPTLRDIKDSRKPVLERYGPDELRRRVESTRFGRRVLWPHEKTRGVLYFDAADSIDHARVEIPASTLFDMTDAGVLVSSPAH